MYFSRIKIITLYTKIWNSNDTQRFQTVIKTKDIIIRPTNAHSNESLYRIVYKNKTFHIDTINDAYHISTPIKRTDEFISWYKSNIRSARYITHTMLQPPNQLTYPLHIRTILQKIKNRSGTLSVSLYKSSFPNQLLLSVTDDSSLHAFSKLNTYYLVPVYNYYRTLYKTL